MLILKYAEIDHSTASRIKERLQELTLAFREQKNQQLTEVELFDGTDSFKGLTAIQHYLDNLEKDLHSWYYCAC